METHDTRPRHLNRSTTTIPMLARHISERILVTEQPLALKRGWFSRPLRGRGRDRRVREIGRGFGTGRELLTEN